MTFTEQAADLFERVLSNTDFPRFCQERFLGLSLADILGQPMEPEARLELGVLRELAALLAMGMVADWCQRAPTGRQHDDGGTDK